MTEGDISKLINPDYKAKLVRERFVVTPKKKSASENEVLTALANRLNFTCFDSHGDKQADFIVRAQNIHTTLRIGARVAEHWYNYGHLNQSGKDRFRWDYIYRDETKDYEDRWNPNCWASVYKNGNLVCNTEPPENNDVLHIIEKVYAHEKCSYQHIPWIAQRLFAQAKRDVDIEYDSNTAMELFGDAGSIKSHIIYRDAEGRNEVMLDMMQKTSRYVKGAKGAKVKLHECLDISALVFEGYQLGFVIGRNNYNISNGITSLGHRDAVQTDFAVRRLKILDDELMRQKNLHNLIFKPKPDFHANIKRVEASFDELESV